MPVKTHAVMPVVRAHTPNIDREWALSLVGLRVKVPQNWWPGYSSTALSAGTIAEVDFDDRAGRYFQLELDVDKKGFYLIP